MSRDLGGLALAGLAWLAACAAGPGAGPRGAAQDPGLAELAKPPGHRRGGEQGRPDRHELELAGARLVAYAAPELRPEVELLFDQVRTLDARGMKFADGDRLSFAWTTLTLREQLGELVFMEPSYADDPEHGLREGVQVTMEVLASQRALMDRLALPPSAVDFDEHVLVAHGALELDEVYLVRVESPGGRMTGWRVAADSLVGEGMVVDSIPVHELLRRRPELMECLLLPPGYMAFFAAKSLVSVIDGEDREVWPPPAAGEEESP